MVTRRHPKIAYKTPVELNWTAEQYGYFQQIMNDQWSGQTQKRQQALVLLPGMDPVQLKDMAELYNTNLDEWLVMQIGAKFGVPQQQLGIPMRSYLHSGSQNQTSMDLADKFAIDSLVNFMVNCINDLTRRFMGTGPEITMTATSGNSDESDFQRAQADASDVNNGIRTRNEIRAERGAPLITDPEADVLAVTAGNAVVFLPGQLHYQEMMEQQIEQGSTAMADPNVGTPSGHEQLTTGSAPTGIEPTDNAPASPKSKSSAAETANRSVGHMSSGSGVAATGTQRRSKAANHNNGPQPSAARASGDTGSYHEKELSAFLKFAKARFNGNKAYRVFEFHHVDPANAAILNNAAYDGSLDDVKSLVDQVRKTTAPLAAGLCILAADSGRVLMLQRAIDDTDPASGDFEFPGGHVDGGESPYDAAVREFHEETGCTLPDGECINEWLSPNGVYQLFVYKIESESDVAINTDPAVRRVLNPDDPDGDCPETAIWMAPDDLSGFAGLRSECKVIPFADITRVPATLDG